MFLFNNNKMFFKWLTFDLKIIVNNILVSSLTQLILKNLILAWISVCIMSVCHWSRQVFLTQSSLDLPWKISCYLMDCVVLWIAVPAHLEGDRLGMDGLFIWIWWAILIKTDSPMFENIRALTVWGMLEILEGK